MTENARGVATDAAAPPPGFAVDYVPLYRQRPPAADQFPRGPFITLALCWIAGTALGSFLPWPLLWLAIVMAGLAATGFFLCRKSAAGARAWGMVSLVAGGAAWFVISEAYVSTDHLCRHLTAEPGLARVSGRIDSPVSVNPPQRGLFAAFSYEPPTTTFVIAADAVWVDGQWRSTQGRLAAKIRQAETRLREGDRIEATGWMQLIDGPSNPGDFDFAAMYRDRGVDGRITMSVRGNCKVIEPAGAASNLAELRTSITDGCAQSLRLGLKADPQRIAFLDTLLLGRWSRDLEALSESFRKTGLVHILSISGAHLTILMLLVWMVVHLFTRHPARAALIVLLVLMVYMLAVPWRVPIIRAGIMAGLVCLGAASGRKVRAIDMIALSAFLVLIWRPGDLFNAGAQLSFGVVAGLLIFTTRVSHYLFPDPLVIPPAEEMRIRTIRWGVNYVAANIVAFVISFPLVAFHFGFISPLSIVLSLLSLPVVTAVLGLGYLKILAGAVLPSAGFALAGPLEWVSDSMTGLVEHASNWPASTVMLAGSPSTWWTIGTLALGCAVMAGWFAGRRAALTLAISLGALWLIVPHHPRVAAFVRTFAPQPAVTLHMFSVGDGSCFLIQLPAGAGRRPHTLMFDCGSQGFLDVGARNIVPSLRALRVNHIDTLFISHADLDHFCGVLDVVSEVPVGRVLVPAQMLIEAGQDKTSATALLIEGLRDRRVTVETVSRGWKESIGEADAAILWPPESFRAERANSTSLVLSLRVAGRHILLNGDIDQVAIPALLAMNDDLRADITDLPHHGSFVASSERWFAAVKPTVALQSSGPARLRGDKWLDLLRDRSVTRLITAELGMVTVVIDRVGAITWSGFRKEPAPSEP